MSQAEEQSGLGKPKPKRVFRNFAEYWHFLRVLNKDQQTLISESLTESERASLQRSYKKGCWHDLFMRNACDYTIDRLKDNYGVDLLELRMKVLRGQPQLVQRAFWEYAKSCFTDEDVDWSDIAYIFGGIAEEEYDRDYLKIVRSNSRK